MRHMHQVTYMWFLYVSLVTENYLRPDDQHTSGSRNVSPATFCCSHTARPWHLGGEHHQRVWKSWFQGDRAVSRDYEKKAWACTLKLCARDLDLWRIREGCCVSPFPISSCRTSVLPGTELWVEWNTTVNKLGIIRKHSENKTFLLTWGLLKTHFLFHCWPVRGLPSCAPNGAFRPKSGHIQSQWGWDVTIDSWDWHEQVKQGECFIRSRVWTRAKLSW